MSQSRFIVSHVKKLDYARVRHLILPGVKIWITVS